MANLKELIVNGASRFIGKVYIDDSHIVTINNTPVTETPKFTDTTYTTFTSAAAGLIKASGSSNTSAYYMNGAGNWTIPTNTTYTTFTTGVNGLATATGSGKNTTAYFLNGSGTWTTPANTTYANFTSAAAGLVKASGSSNTTAYVLTGNHAWTSAKLTDTTYTTFTSAAAGLVKASGSSNTSAYYLNGAGNWTTPTDTKNTAGSTDSSSKLFLIGATAQAANPQTYSHDTVYVGTDGCLYSNSQKVFTVAGGTINGTVSVDNELSANSATLGNLVVTGDATFTNDLRGNLIGTVNGSTPIKGGSNSTSTVTITPTTTSIYSMSSTGSVTAGTATTPASIDTSKFSGGSFTRGTFTAGSLTMAMDTTDTKKLNITFTAPTHAADSFTAASLASGFYTAGTKGTPTVVTLPTRSSAVTVWTGYSGASAAAQTFTGTPC